MKKRSFTIGLFIVSLAGLTSCSTSTTSMAMWKEVDFYDYEMCENLGPDEQGIDYYLMNDNCCYVRANMDVLENILSESQDKNINYDIPASYKGHTVKGVVGGGFGGPRVIYSFFESDWKYNIHLPETISYIGDTAFFNTNIASINIPKDISYIGFDAFAECKVIKRTEYENGIYFGPKNNPYFCLEKIIDRDVEHFVVHKDCKNIQTDLPQSLKEFNLPKGLTVYGRFDYVFESIESITLPKSLRLLECRFRNCSSLKSITFNSNLEYMEGVSNCPKLERIEMSDSIKLLGQSTITDCSSLKYIKLSKSLKEIPYDLIHGCPQLDTLIIPKSVKKIDGCFVGSDSPLLKTITYLGKVEEWKKIENINLIQDTQYCPVNKIECSDGVIEFPNKK